MALAANAKEQRKHRRGESTKSVYETLHDMILSLELAPGQKVDEESLADLCGVSRTPVRESLFRLAAEGLVVLLPNRVTQVAHLDISTLHDYLESMDLIQRAINRWAAIRRRPDDIANIKQLAAAFEGLAAKRDLKGMVLANRDFHTAIGEAARNDLLAQSYQRLLDVGLRIARFTLHQSPLGSNQSYEVFMANVLEDHRRMIAAVEEQDADEAERLALLHTERTRCRFREYLATSEQDVRIQDPEIRIGSAGSLRA